MDCSMPGFTVHYQLSELDPNSCLWSQWCHPTISFSVFPFFSRLQSFPASESFPVSQFFPSGGQRIGVLASALALPLNIQNWSLRSDWFISLRPNYGGGNEDNGNLLQKVPGTHCLTLLPLTLQQATTDPCLCWRLLDTHKQVWVSTCGVTVPFSWVLVCTKLCLCPPKVCSPSPV